MESLVPGKLYFCEHEGCDFSTKDWRALADHDTVHQDPGRVFLCEYCDDPKKEFNEFEFKRHLSDHLDECRFYECDVCRDFSSRDSAEVSAHGEFVHSLPRTPSNRPKFSAINNNVKRIFDEIIDSDEEVMEKTQTPRIKEVKKGRTRKGKREESGSKDDDLEELISMNKLGDKYKCPRGACEFWSKFRGDFRIHITSEPHRLHTKCSLCHFAHNDRTILLEHERRHGISGTCRCPVCGFLSLDKPSLVAHKKSHHLDANDAEIDSVSPGDEEILDDDADAVFKQIGGENSLADLGHFDNGNSDSASKDPDSERDEENGEKDEEDGVIVINLSASEDEGSDDNRAATSVSQGKRKRGEDDILIPIPEPLPKKRRSQPQAAVSYEVTRPSLIKTSLKCDVPRCKFWCNRKTAMDAHQRYRDHCYYGCDKCPFYCNTKGKLALHLERHSVPYSIICPHCYFLAEDHRRLKVHFKFHRKLARMESNLDADDSEQGDSDDEDIHLQDDAASDGGGNPGTDDVGVDIVEPISPAPGRSFSGLSLHLSDSEEPESDDISDIASDMIIKCGKCGRLFGSEADLRAHLESHRRDRNVFDIQTLFDFDKASASQPSQSRDSPNKSNQSDQSLGSPKKGSRPRFTKAEVRILEDVFTQDPTPSTETHRRLALKLNLPQRRIQNWFNVRRWKLNKTKKRLLSGSDTTPTRQKKGVVDEEPLAESNPPRSSVTSRMIRVAAQSEKPSQSFPSFEDELDDMDIDTSVNDRPLRDAMSHRCTFRPCEFWTNDTAEFQAHEDDHSKGKTSKKYYGCDHCAFISPYKPQVMAHQELHSSPDAVECPRCYVLAESWDELKTHLAHH